MAIKRWQPPKPEEGDIILHVGDPLQPDMLGLGLLEPQGRIDRAAELRAEMRRIFEDKKRTHDSSCGPMIRMIVKADIFTGEISGFGYKERAHLKGTIADTTGNFGIAVYDNRGVLTVEQDDRLPSNLIRNLRGIGVPVSKRT